MHLTDEQVLQLLDPGVSAADRLTQAPHLGGCGECRERIAAAQREAEAIVARLSLLDHPVPAVSAQSVMRAARARRAGHGRWAAAILLSFGLVGVAYAAPGSPLPAWIASLAEWLAPTSGEVESPVPPTPEPVPAQAGIAVTPGERLTISLEIGDGGTARVSLTSGGEVTLRAESGGVGFTAGAGQLVVVGRAEPASIEVQIPRSAPRVEILRRGEQVFLKDGDRIAAVSAAGPDGSYLLRFGP